MNPNSDNMSRFTCLYDEVIHAPSHTLDIAGTGFATPYHPIRSFYKKINHLMYFQGSDALIASQAKGSIFAIFGTNIDDSRTQVAFTIKFKDL